METYRVLLNATTSALVEIVEQSIAQTIINIQIVPSQAGDKAMLTGDPVLDIEGENIFLPEDGRKWWLIPVNPTDPPVLYAPGCTFSCACDGKTDPSAGTSPCFVMKATFPNRVEFYCAAGSCLDCCQGKMTCPPGGPVKGSFLAYGTDLLILNGVSFT